MSFDLTFLRSGREESPVPTTLTGLRAEFFTDATQTFLVESEFAQIREFAIIEDGVEVIFNAHVVWDTEILKDRAIVQQQGVFLGSVCCYILSSLFSVEPRPEQIIYTRRLFPPPAESVRKGWRVLDITEAEEMYYLDLDKLIA